MGELRDTFTASANTSISQQTPGLSLSANGPQQQHPPTKNMAFLGVSSDDLAQTLLYDVTASAPNRPAYGLHEWQEEEGWHAVVQGELNLCSQIISRKTHCVRSLYSSRA
jgi:hypothetical protein